MCHGKRCLGWLTGAFTSVLTVFQSYQEDRRVMMKGCVQWVLFTLEKGFRPQRVSNLGPLYNQASD